MAYDTDGVVMPVSGKYSCLNPKCPMVIESAQKAAGKAPGGIDWDDATVLSYYKEGVSFNTMDERYRCFCATLHNKAQELQH